MKNLVVFKSSTSREAGASATGLYWLWLNANHKVELKIVTEEILISKHDLIFLRNE